MVHQDRIRKEVLEMKKIREIPGLFKSIAMAHFILFLHILLIAGLGFLVLFFRGVVFYMPWIMLGGAVALTASGYWMYRRMKIEKKTLREALSLPMFQNRSVEVSILGGFASLKLGAPESRAILPASAAEASRQLEDPESLQISELTELVRLLDNNLITLDEYQQAKRQLFGS